MTQANISALKARLSSYLADVRRGGEVLVYDRTTAIARRVTIDRNHDDVSLVAESSLPATLKRLKGVRPRKPIDVDELLRELRQDR